MAEESLMQYGYTREESEFVLQAVYDNCFTHEDFIKLLKEKGVSQDCPITVDVAS